MAARLPAKTFTLDEVDPERIHFGELVTKQHTTEKGPVTNYSFPIIYVLGEDPKDQDDPDRCKIYIQLPEVVSPYGIKVGQYGSSIIIPFNFETPDPEDKTDYLAIYNKIDAIFKRIAVLCQKKKKALNMLNFTADNPVATGLRHIIWQPDVNKRNYLMILALIDFEDAEKGTSFKTAFTIPTTKGPQNIQWSALSNASIRHYPLMQLDDVMSTGTSMSIRSKLRSTYVTDVKAKEDYNPQKELTEKLMKADPTAGLRVEQALANLSKIQAEKLKEYQAHNESVAALAEQQKANDPLANLPKANTRKALPAPAKPKALPAPKQQETEPQQYESPPEEDYPQSEEPEQPPPPKTIVKVNKTSPPAPGKVFLSRNPSNRANP